MEVQILQEPLQLQEDCTALSQVWNVRDLFKGMQYTILKVDRDNSNSHDSEPSLLLQICLPVRHKGLPNT